MARDTKEHAEDLDGLAKNLDKLGKEGERMADAARKAMQGDSHDRVMDAVTEATRASPYGAAHVAVIVIAILAIALGVALLV
jgi:hypothetical protein